MIECGRFLAGSREGIEEVRTFAHLAGCFISHEPAKGMAGCQYVNIWAPAYCLPNHADARALNGLGLLDPMSDADLYD